MMFIIKTWIYIWGLEKLTKQLNKTSRTLDDIHRRRSYIQCDLEKREVLKHIPKSARTQYLIELFDELWWEEQLMLRQVNDLMLRIDNHQHFKPKEPDNG